MIMAHRLTRVEPQIRAWRRANQCTWHEAIVTWPGGGLYGYGHLTLLDDFAPRFRQALLGFRVLGSGLKA